MSVAFVFPGQGSQAVGMGRALVDAFPDSRAVFDEADAAVGFALSRLCFEGPEAELQLTANTQPAILATSVAALRATTIAGGKVAVSSAEATERILKQNTQYTVRITSKATGKELSVRFNWYEHTAFA